MMSTIRPIFQYQYGNANSTAANPLQFLDNYFNNTDGNHVATPEPVTITFMPLAAAGTTVSTIASGLGGVTIANFSFETPTLQGSSYQADPAGAAWTFSGYCRDRQQQHQSDSSFNHSHAGHPTVSGEHRHLTGLQIHRRVPEHLPLRDRSLRSRRQQRQRIYVLLDANDNQLASPNVIPPVKPLAKMSMAVSDRSSFWPASPITF